MKFKFLILLFILIIVNTEVKAQNLSNRAAYRIGTFTAYTVLESLINLEAEAERGFYITRICINPGTQTTAGHVPVQLIRTTTVSSAGTVISPEQVANNYLSKNNPTDNNWAGIARTGGTEGTSGAGLDLFTVFIPTGTTLGNGEICKEYCIAGTKCPFVSKGVNNGVKLMFQGGTGAGFQSASIDFVAQ